MPQLAILDSKAINAVEKSTLSDAVCEIKLWLLHFRPEAGSWYRSGGLDLVVLLQGKDRLRKVRFRNTTNFFLQPAAMNVHRCLKISPKIKVSKLDKLYEF
jgi:hypothetical protein